MYIPRILAEDTGTSSCPSINIGSSFGCSNAKEIIISLHFFTIIKKRMGPSTVPWGTPPLTGNQSEKTPLILTRCFLPDRKTITQFIYVKFTHL